MKLDMSDNNPIIRTLGGLWDLIILNVLFILTSIPLITIGASITALEYVTLRMVRGEETYAAREYFAAFSANFKKAVCTWLPLLALLLFFSADLYVIYRVIDPSWQMLQYPVWLALILVIAVFHYVFALIGNYDNSLGAHLKNAALLGIANFPTTVFFTVMTLLIVVPCFNHPTYRVVVFSLFLFCGFGLCAWVKALFLNHIFEKL